MKIQKILINLYHASITRFSSTRAILLLLLLLAVLFTTLIHHAPAHWYLAQLKLSPNTSDSDLVETRLGYHELGQYKGYNSADLQHLKARFDPQQGWLLSNISPKKKAIAVSNKAEFRLKRWSLKQGDIITIGRYTLQVDALNATDARQLRLRCTNCTQNKRENERVVEWQQTHLSATEANFAACPDNTVIDRLQQQWQQYRQQTRTLFTLGGSVQCHHRWKLPIPLASAKIIWQQGQYWLVPLRHDIDFRFQRQQGEEQSLNDLETPVVFTNDKGEREVIKKLIIGRTHYTVTRDEKALILTPDQRLHLFAESLANQTQGANNDRITINADWHKVSWIGAITAVPTFAKLLQWGTIKRFLLVLLVLLTLSYLLATVLHAWCNQGQIRAKTTVTSLFAQLSVSAIGFSVGFALVGENLILLLLLMALSWSFVSTLLWRNQYFTAFGGLGGWFYFIILLLAGIGLLIQVQLAAGAMNSHWLRFPQGYMVFLLACAMPLSFIALTPANALQGIWRWLARAKESTIKGFYHLFLLLLVLLLIMQVASGTETGLGFLQPIEFIKLLLVIVLAKMTLDFNETRMMSENIHHRLLRRFTLGIAVLLVIYLSVIFGVRDFSPLLIIATLLMAYAWIIVRHPVKPRFSSIWKARGLFIIFPLVLLVSLGTYLHADPDSWLANAFPQTERFKIWSEPWNYPDLGKQLQLSLEWVHEGGWLGNDWFGRNGAILNLPAVQDDFILAFLLYKGGGLIGLLLLITQMAWLMVQFSLVNALLTQLPNEREQRLSQALLAYILYGLAWMQLLHWLISWGNVLGFMPIMGQPMTWLSIGNSHLMAIALPSMLLSLVALRMVKIEITSK